LIGLFVAVYVWLKFPHPTGVPHGPDKFGLPVPNESLAVYLFAFPFFQVWVFLVPATVSLRWTTFKRRSMEREHSTDEEFPSTRNIDSIWLFERVNLVFVLVGVALLCATVSVIPCRDRNYLISIGEPARSK
jgi:hypothetical protein